MADIRHRVGIRASAAKVFKAISTTDGLSHWWITETAGDPRTGGTILFGFADMKVVRSVPNKLVKWKCIKGPEGWVGTTVTFELKPAKGQTFVLFTHADWKKPDEFMHHCSTKWAVFLLSMKGWLERSEGRPAPYDVKIEIED